MGEIWLNYSCINWDAEVNRVFFFFIGSMVKNLSKRSDDLLLLVLKGETRDNRKRGSVEEEMSRQMIFRVREMVEYLSLTK